MTELPDNILHLPQYQVLGCKSTDDEMHFQVDVPDPIACEECGVHMKASWIFSANDVIVNAGVILAGLLVTWTGSRYPDLVIGFIIGLVVLNGARRILQLKA